MAATIYNLDVRWGGGNYLTEIDLGFIPTLDVNNLTGAGWGELDGVSATDAHYFSRIHRGIPAGAAVRIRFIGSFGQRGDWTYALYSTDTTLAIDSFRCG